MIVADTDEEAQIVHAMAQLGWSFLSLVRSMDRAGHVTLKGHFQYIDERQMEQPLAAAMVSWLRQVSWSQNRDDSELQIPAIFQAMIGYHEHQGDWDPPASWNVSNDH